METLEKMATSVDAPQKNKRCTKKVHLGLQLDMASQRCLVADCGICVATSALAPLASRRGKNWKSECRPDMIRMVENHRFLMYFFLTLEEQNRVTAQATREFSLLSHTPANRNECPCCKHFLTTPANTRIFFLPSKIRISNSSPLQGRRVNRLPCFRVYLRLFMVDLGLV